MKYYGGCDVGSTYTKAVILDENGKICADLPPMSRLFQCHTLDSPFILKLSCSASWYSPRALLFTSELGRYLRRNSIAVIRLAASICSLQTRGNYTM